VCGRLTLHISDLGELRLRLGVQRILVDAWRPRYNIAPTQSMPVVLVRDNERVLQSLRYGLVPSWSKSAASASRLINARVETVATLPSFRRALRTDRCVIPATGYYEWQAMAGRRTKQPVWIHPTDGGILALAGIAESWRSPEGEVIDTFAILTTEASGAIARIHDRMPLQLLDDDVERWLRPGELGPSALSDLLGQSTRVEHMSTTEVDRRVNSPRLDDPACIAPRGADLVQAASGRQLTLFK
jgi:putative SOS response-associated peptidase YedK